MKIGKIIPWILLVAVLAAGYFLITRKAGTEAPAEADKEAPAPVEVAKIERKTISEPVTVYGSVVAQPARLQVVAAAFETQVRHILVAPGQVVNKGDPLVEVEPSSAAELQLRQAMNAADAAKRDLEQTQSRFNMKLATNEDLGTSQKAANDAQLQLDSLRQAGVATDNLLRAGADGIVAKVDAQDGQIVPVGGALLETVSANAIEVKLGVEPEDLSLLKPGVPVEIEPVQGGASVQGAVRLVTLRMDTDTRLVDVYVSLPQQSGLLLDSYVKGAFDRVAENTLVAPAVSLEEGEDGFSVFTVTDNKAVRQSVVPGLESGDSVQVTGTGLHEGDTVVTTGAHELDDGDAVTVGGGAKDQ
jgi:RND family efflux transporter MFP subunit